MSSELFLYYSVACRLCFRLGGGEASFVRIHGQSKRRNGTRPDEKCSEQYVLSGEMAWWPDWVKTWRLNGKMKRSWRRDEKPIKGVILTARVLFHQYRLHGRHAKPAFSPCKTCPFMSQDLPFRKAKVALLQTHRYKVSYVSECRCFENAVGFRTVFVRLSTGFWWLVRAKWDRWKIDCRQRT